MDLNAEDRNIIIQALEILSVPVNQSDRIKEIIIKLKYLNLQEEESHKLAQSKDSLTDIDSPDTN